MPTSTAEVDLSEVFWWMGVNIVLPVLLPVLGFALARASRNRSAATTGQDWVAKKIPFVLLFKDGQLCWANLLMCFASFSDFLDGIAKSKTAPPSIKVLILVAILVVFSSGILAANGAVDSVEPLDNLKSSDRLGQVREWIAYYAVAFWSSVLTIAAAIIFIKVHFWAV